MSVDRILLRSTEDKPFFDYLKSLGYDHYQSGENEYTISWTKENKNACIQLSMCKGENCVEEGIKRCKDCKSFGQEILKQGHLRCDRCIRLKNNSMHDIGPRPDGPLWGDMFFN